MTTAISRRAKEFPDRLARALTQEMEVEATECKRRTPVKTGDLRDSIHVTPPTKRGDTISVQIVCGGIAAPYAIYVHENLEALHPIGQAKFIESVLRESSSYISRRITERLKETE